MGGLRIGIDRDYALRGIDRGQAAALEEALKVLESRGARLVDVKMPALDGMVPVWSAITGAEVRQAHASTYPAKADAYGPYFRAFLESSAGVTEKQVADARAWRAAFADRLHAMLESVDAMACPSGGDPAWPVTHELQVGPLAAFHAAWSASAPRAGVHDADGFGRHAGDLPAIRLLERRAFHTASSSPAGDSAKRRYVASGTRTKRRRTGIVAILRDRECPRLDDTRDRR